MSNPEFDVIVVGAGIAGSALALSLAGSGLRLALVEARPLDTDILAPEQGVNSFDARVSAITPTSSSLLEQLECWQTILATRASPYRAMHVWDAEGTGSIQFEAREVDVSALGHIVENRLLTATLLGRLVSSEVTVFSPARVANLIREPGQSPLLELEDGRCLTGRLLVGADGALSRIRELAEFRTREWDYDHHAVVATVQVERDHAATAYQRFLESGPLAFLPLPDIRGEHFCSIVWSTQPDLSRELMEMTDADFCDQIGRELENRLGRVLACSQRFSFPLRQRHAADYVQAGVALVGDAAHTIHPLAGQGINLGLQDVAVLAEEILTATRRDLDPGSLAVLARYQRRRKGENLLMMAAMDGFKRLFGARPLPLRWLRNSGMRLVGESGLVKQQLMRHAMGIR